MSAMDTAAHGQTVASPELRQCRDTDEPIRPLDITSAEHG